MSGKNILIKGRYIVLALCLTYLAACTSKEISLGTLSTNSKVSFVKNESGQWGIAVSGGTAPQLMQQKPAVVEVCQSDTIIHELASGYKTVEKSGTGVVATAEIKDGENATFNVTDKWSISDAVINMHRKVEVSGNGKGRFNSSFRFEVDSTVQWQDVNCLAPGALYGDPVYDGERSAGGTMNYEARRFIMREDILPAPLFALSFKNGASVALLDPSPNGQSTTEETKLSKDVMTDSRILVGAMGAWQNAGQPIEFGFRFPATSNSFSGRPNSSVKERWIRRYHPIEQDFSHSYTISFRLGSNESFSDVTRNTWRWAWSTLDPKVTKIDVEQMRTILIDHLAAQAASIGGRTAIPFALATFDTTKLQWNWTMAAMGFVSKNIECADQLLREGDRDKTERGQKMRQTGLSIISSMINALPTVPLQATGYDLKTGKPWDHIWLAPWLRNATEDMRVLMRAYRREKANGVQHPEWFAWVKQYIDWLIQQQREDGSFPRRWEPGTNEIVEQTGTTSYAPVPLLVIISEETGDPKYLQSAVKAANFVWESWGKRGLFIGGASDNPNITDKEAGMLSMEAFLSLYDTTKEQKWLDRAKVAADFAESWMWIWNLPMPVDADNAKLHWKKGVPTIGLQGITAQGAGGVDEYLSWAVPSYAKLYKLTNDQHYLDVAMVLLHDTKSMVAIPGRLYDMKGPGWQQENFRMGPGRGGRGVGAHRFWLPWISANHLYGINGLEEFDKELYKQMTEIN